MTLWIIGLGNPGSRFATTRHNAGYWFVDAVAEALGVRWTNPWFRPFSWARFRRGDDDLLVLKAKTFMNVSVKAFRALVRSSRVEAPSVLVIFDQMDLPPGELRLKRSGSSAGHNGLKSLDALWEGRYPRLAVGVGRPTGVTVVEHVLSAPPPGEREAIDKALRAAALIVASEWPKGWEALIHEINSLAKSPQNL